MCGSVADGEGGGTRIYKIPLLCVSVHLCNGESHIIGSLCNIESLTQLGFNVQINIVRTISKGCA